jgi:hypothetical protein
MLVMHCPSHFGASAAHLPSMLHTNATSLIGQSISVHGLQGSPHSRPAHGSSPPHPGQPVEQRPFTHSDFGHDVVPSGHIVQGARIAGHSASVMHCAAHVGNLEMHWPITHSALGHTVLPSAHSWHGRSTTGQSIDVSHWFSQTGNAGLHSPFAPQ